MSQQPPTYLFTCTTGGGGNTGGNTLKAFYSLAKSQNIPFKIRLGARNPSKALQQHPDLKNSDDTPPEAIHFDLTKPETYGSALEGVSAAFIGNPDVGGMDSVELLEKFVDAAVNAKTKTGKNLYVIKLSGGALNEDICKICDEDGVHLFDPHRFAAKVFGEARKVGKMDLSIVDVQSWFYQNYTGLLGGLVKTGHLAVPNGNAKLPCIDTRDIGEVAASMMLGREKFANKDVVLTGNYKLTTDEWAEDISKATGKDVKGSTDVEVCKNYFGELEKVMGISMWDEIKPLFDFERRWGKKNPQLHPERYEEITKKKHRTPSQFCKDMSAVGAWDDQ